MLIDLWVYFAFQHETQFRRSEKNDSNTLLRFPENKTHIFELHFILN